MKTFLELKSKKNKYQTPDVEIVIKDCNSIYCDVITLSKEEVNDNEFDAGGMNSSN